MTVTAMTETDANTAIDGATARGKGQRKSKKLRVIALASVLVLVTAAWFLFLKPAPAHTSPEPGQVVSLEAIQVNLAGGHYLKVGVALQLTREVKEAPDGSKALDTVIALFSGRGMEDFALPDQREALKKRLTDDLRKRYEGEVMDVYFTDFVTQ